MAALGFFATLVRSPSFKFVLVGVLVLFISALSGAVWLLSAERQSRANSVEAEVARDWGGNQRILGPYLIVPYTLKTQRFVDGKAVDIEVARQAVFLPDTLNVNGAVQTEKRRRAIYDVTVYQGKLTLEGQFRPADFEPRRARDAGFHTMARCVHRARHPGRVRAQEQCATPDRREDNRL